jgi:hypothetical protein
VTVIAENACPLRAFATESELAREYIGMTDNQGRTERIQLLGPGYTKVKMKVDVNRYGVSGGY